VATRSGARRSTGRRRGSRWWGTGIELHPRIRLVVAESWRGSGRGAGQRGR
jgi:hypothetical protein